MTGSDEQITASPARPLTRKQKVFVETYLTTWNATEAARRAAYAHPNMAGPRLMVNDGIQAAIERRMEELAMEANEILARLAEQARVNISIFWLFDEEGNATGINWENFRIYGHLVKSLSWTRTGPKLELHDGQAALVHLGKHRELFKEGASVVVNNILDLEEWKQKRQERLANVTDIETE